MFNAKECLELLEKRKAIEQIRRSNVREELQSNPFDPRNEVSADGRHIAFQQAVPFEFAQVVAELVEPVTLCTEMKRSEDGFMNLFGCRAANCVAA